MSTVRGDNAQLRSEILDLVNGLAGDWEYDGVISADTRFLADLGLESLDLVVLGTSIQHRYGKLPFSEFLEEIGRRPAHERDVTVGELISYVCAHRPHKTADRS